MSCNCRYYWSFNLYCAHIFSVFNILQVRSIEKFEPFTRWTRKFHASVYSDEKPEVAVNMRAIENFDDLANRHPVRPSDELDNRAALGRDTVEIAM